MNKYHNKKVTTPDGVFDSKKEFHRWEELKILQRVGEISSLKRQVPYAVVEKTDKYRKAEYVADFEYKDKSGETVIEDVKGMRGGAAYQMFKLKKKIIYAIYGIDIREV